MSNLAAIEPQDDGSFKAFIESSSGRHTREVTVLMGVGRAVTSDPVSPAILEMKEETIRFYRHKQAELAEFEALKCRNGNGGGLCDPDILNAQDENDLYVARGAEYACEIPKEEAMA